MGGLSLASGGWTSNLIVFLINEFNMKSIAAAKVFNVVSGLTTILPIVGGIIADSYLACFTVISISSFISALGILLLLLTITIDALRPQACGDGSNLCTSPSTNQYVFFTAFIVYVEDNISWAWGLGISLACNILGLAIFLAGKHFYRHVKEQGGSPFVNLARVVVVATQKWRVPLSEQTQHYYHDPNDKTTLVPTKFFKFLNCAAFITEGDTTPDGSISNPWRLCTVQQVEDLKSLIKLFPLWASGVLLSIQLVMQFSLLILQALKMDRHIGPHFEIPAGSMLVFILLFTCIAISIIDRILSPFLSKYTRLTLTPLQRVGIGHVLTIVCMVVSALVESRRLRVAISHHLQGQKDGIVPMSVFWLLPQLALSGIGEGFHFPGHIAFYYQEFPTSLKNTSTAMVRLFIGIAFYLGNVLIDVVQRESGWLPDISFLLHPFTSTKIWTTNQMLCQVNDVLLVSIIQA
ncbi:hypothetical protein KY290_008757 [Solanum tuberosum]|uniref:Uncharacterized protein n=1 Tax=Solanum tuberosum TaxID=4113 RepID=A0ABQ7WAQ4_SOLTU|nr:hypothetical protein KY290_008757 [Solanum tuberosum]